MLKVMCQSAEGWDQAEAPLPDLGTKRHGCTYFSQASLDWPRNGLMRCLVTMPRRAQYTACLRVQRRARDRFHSPPSLWPEFAHAFLTGKV